MLVLMEKKHASTVTDSKFSFTFLCFHFENLVIFAVYPTLCYGGSLLFYFLFDSSVFAKRSVIY